MKVLVILPDVVPYGGTSRFLERLLDIHARRGTATTLLVPTDRCCPELVSLAGQYAAELICSPNRTEADTVPFLTPWYDFLFSWRTVLSCRPGLIIVSTGDPGRLSISLYFPIPVLYVLHSVPEHRFRLLPRWYLRFGAMLNNRIMTVSTAAAKSVSYSMGIPADRIEVVHNSMNTHESRPESAPPIILTAGHLVDYKNPDLWLEVARTVVQKKPDARFVWLGDGNLLSAIREKVKNLSLEGSVQLPGYISDPAVWFAQAQIYFQPSLRESHGIAVLEAMAHGLPCVVADTGGLPESVIDGETGYICPPMDTTAYAGRIIQLLSDYTLRVHMGTTGQLRARIFFSEEIQEQKILDLYRRLTNKSGK
jgi:glycosyltransferase involved in cell wall biosynthesis